MATKLAEMNLNVLASQPLNDWVLVKLIEKGDGAIAIPDSAKERSTLASVVSAGPLVSDLAPGDRVLISRYGMDVEIEGEKLVMVKAAEVYLRFADGRSN